MADGKGKSYYDLLGVSASATEKEIRQAFRKLARRHHPDLNPGDPHAESAFKEINEAYETLSDQESRRKYDRYGADWKRANESASWDGGRRAARTRPRAGGGFRNPFADFDFLGDMGGRRPSAARSSPRPSEINVEVSLEEAYHGVKRMVTLTAGGSERRFEVTIPKGVDTGSVVKGANVGGHDVRLNIVIQPHSLFRREGDDLYVDVSLPLDDAALGAETVVATMTGAAWLKAPPGSRNGQKLRLRGKGMPILGSPDTAGDLYAVLRPEMPDTIGEEERKVFEELRRLRKGEG